MSLRKSNFALMATFLSILILAGCSTSPPTNPEDLCAIFDEKRGWQKDAEEAAARWGASIPVMMAIMYQESSYQDDARPDRVRFMGIPLWRPSDAYGYAQAKDATWEWYEEKSGNNGDRDDFDDAIDFIAWYNSVSNSLNGISHENANSLYLAYHEGHGGFSNESWKSKAWLIDTAARVQARANRYRDQLARCS